MRVMQRLGDGGHQLGGLGEGQPALPHPFGQVGRAMYLETT
jgi:hypothetical protein